MTTLPSYLHDAALRVVEAARDQRAPSPDLRAALADFDRAATPPANIVHGIPAALWRVLCIADRAVAVLAAIDRPFRAGELAAAIGCGEASTRTLLTKLVRDGVIVREPGFPARYRYRTGAKRPRVHRRTQAATVALLVERPVLTTGELAEAFGVAPTVIVNRLYTLKRQGVVRQLAGTGVHAQWELTPEVRDHAAPSL